MLAAFMLPCNDGNEKTGNISNAADRPGDVNEAVTNSTKIANGSVIVPDTNNTRPIPSAGMYIVGSKEK